MRVRRLWFLASILVGSYAGAPVWALADAPQRVVSINLCADQLLVLLAENDSLRSVTFLSAQPDQSYVADRVGDIPVNHGEAEEILALQPDLVVAGRFAARPAVALLRRFDIPVLDLPIPASFDEIRAHIMLLSARLGVDARGAAMIADMDERLAAVAVANGPMPRALVLGARGFTSGPGTLVHEVLSSAGLQNVAGDLGITGFGRVDLEEIVDANPDIIILNQPVTGAPSLARQVLAHPALRRFEGQIIHMEPALWTCGGPYTVHAVELLADAIR